jgi:hypothetical protein
MPHTFSFEEPVTEKRVTFTPLSYLWAGLFGVAYAVKVAGLRVAARALLISAIFIIGVFAIPEAVPYIPGQFRAAVLVCLVPVLIYLHGLAIMKAVRKGYRRRGWVRGN